MPNLQAARCGWTVDAGMIPGEAMKEFRRSFSISSAEWEQAKQSNSALELLLDRFAAASAYAARLTIDSASGLAPNWVCVEYVWF